MDSETGFAIFQSVTEDIVARSLWALGAALVTAVISWITQKKRVDSLRARLDLLEAERQPSEEIPPTDDTPEAQPAVVVDALDAARMIYDANDPMEAERLWAAYDRTAHYPYLAMLAVHQRDNPVGHERAEAIHDRQVLEFGWWAAGGEAPE